MKFAVILSGSGVFDGAEIHEATMTLYAITKNGGTYQVFAPNIEQAHVINHITGEKMDETRNVLVESARIARGKADDLAKFKAENYDALIFPGGFGVAKNLSNFAFKGTDCEINTEVENAVKTMAEQNKPIGALCISPVIIAKILDKAEVTIGTEKETISAIEKMGGTHKKTTHGEVVKDEKYNLYTTPCYMLDATIVDIADGAINIIKAMMDI